MTSSGTHAKIGNALTAISMSVILATSVLVISLLPAQSVAAFPNNNGKIAFTSVRDGNFEIYTMNPDGSEQTRLTNNAVSDFNPFWPPDGSKIAFFRGDYPISIDLYVMEPDGSLQKKLANANGTIVDPAWSPDGTKIAFTRTDNGTLDIYSVKTDGSGRTNLTNHTGINKAPKWSQDGTKVQFESYRNGTGWGLYIVNSDGTDMKKLSDFVIDGSNTIFWSPDSTKIGIMKTFDPPEEYLPASTTVIVANVDGSDQKIIREGGTNPGRMSWSPTGSRITSEVGTVRGPGLVDLRISNADGTDMQPLTGHIGDSDAQFSPDGTKVVFTYSHNNSTTGTVTSGIATINADGTNEKILSPVSGVDFDADWGASAQSPEESALTVQSIDLAGKPVSGLWTTIRGTDGSLVKSGFTPISFVGLKGDTYKVAITNYDGKVFSKWQDNNSTSQIRTVSLTEASKVLTAMYDTGDSLRGFSPLTYTATSERPALTVNATTIAGNEPLHMWTIIDPQSTNTSGTTYKVYAGNYLNIVFDHWSDGNKDRIRTITIDKPTSIIAYYKTGASTVSFNAHYHDAAGPGTPVCDDIISGNCGPFFGSAEKSGGGVVSGTWSQHLPRGALCSSGGPITEMDTNGTTFTMTGTYTGTCDIFDPGAAVIVSGECGANSEISFTVGGVENRFVGDSTCLA